MILKFITIYLQDKDSEQNDHYSKIYLYFSAFLDKNYSISYMEGDSGIKDLLIMLAVNTFLYLILILFIDYNVFGAIKQFCSKFFKSTNNINYQQYLDPDVQKEQKRVYDQYNYGQGGK